MLNQKDVGPPLDAVRKYLHDTLGIAATTRPWVGAGKLPYFLQDSFEVYELRARDRSMLLAFSRRAKSPPLATIRSRLDKLKALVERPVVYVTDALASYERKRLIEQKVPFLVPGNQLYLPDLGIDLREYFRQQTQAPKHALSPATQAMLIKALLEESTQATWYPTTIATELGYTAMTVSRAVRELIAAGIATIDRHGSARSLRMDRPPAETWGLAKPLLRSPVKRTVWTHRNPILPQPERQLPLAGLSALARYSRLAEPALAVYAADLEQWKL